MMIARRSSSSSAPTGTPSTGTGTGALAENNSSCFSKFTARRPAEVSRSVSVLSCSSSGLLKNLLAAVRIISSESPIDTMAEASTRTLIGFGMPLASTSAVWSAMSRSMLIARDGMVVPVVSNGTSIALPGPL